MVPVSGVSIEVDVDTENGVLILETATESRNQQTLMKVRAKSEKEYP